MIRATPLLAFVFILTAVASVRAGDVTTIAGTGVPGYAGDDGPALVALLAEPQGLAVAPDGTIYFADKGNFRIRAISPGGIISTVAGSGVSGDAGDGGPATAATLGHVQSVALDPTGAVLYFADIENNVVRQVDLDTGVIEVFAGTGVAGFDGDGGPATAAEFRSPGHVAVDGDGNVYITDTLNHRIRMVDAATGLITTFAGDGGVTPAGDGGLAAAASFGALGPLAIDGAGNVFLVDHNDGSNQLVRGIEAGSGIIITVAGGGGIVPGFGTATTMDIGNPNALAVDSAGQLFIASAGPQHQVYKVDLASDMLSVFAGTGPAGDTGDGGPALSATFADLSGAAFLPSGELVVTSNAARLRSIAPDGPLNPFNVLISASTSQAFLDSIQDVVGSVIMINVAGRQFLVIPNLSSVGFDVTILANGELVIIDLGALQSVGGDIDITGNLALTTLDLSGLNTVSGSLTISDDPALTAVMISGVASVGGNLSLIGTAATVIELPVLHTVDGDVFIDDNTAATAIDLGSLITVNGAFDVSGNTAATSIDLAALTTVGDDLAIIGNTSAAGIDLGTLTSAGDDVAVNGNTAAAEIDLGSLATAFGDVFIDGNTSATTIDLGSLTTVVGELNVAGNTSATAIDLAALTSTNNDIFVNGNTSVAAVDLGALVSAGDDLVVDGNTSATAIDLSQLATAGGDLVVSGNTAISSVGLASLTATVGGVEVSGNTSATAVDLGQFATCGGDLVVVDNGPGLLVDLGSLISVDGTFRIETSGQGPFDFVGVAVGGNIDLTTQGFTTVAGTTSLRHTKVRMVNGETSMSVEVGPATFVPPVDFAITRINAVALPPVNGLAADGSAAMVDPFAAYEFILSTPTLADEGTLSFEITIDGLSAATKSAVLAALPTGNLTMVTRPIGPGSDWQAFPVCTGGAPPTVGGCVLLETLDAAGEPTAGTPAVLRFTNVVNQLSVWGVAIVSPLQPCGATASAVSLGAGCGADLTATPPLLGERMSLDVAATTAGATGLIFASPVGAAPTPFHGCLIDLDVQHLFFVGTFVTDGSGDAHMNFVVPQKPKFCGRQVMLQAFVISGVRPLQLEISRGLHLTLGN